jgi:hypothetical protein
MAARPVAARSSKPPVTTPATPQQSKRRKRNRQYHQNNREKALQRMRERYAGLTPAQRSLRLWRAKARPPTPKPGSFRARNQRDAALARAYCEWSDVEEVVRIHIAAAVMSELTGEKYVVDHAVPLSNPFVCGLHTHTNLQVMHWLTNSRKANLVWPEMWPVSWESLEILEGAC